MKTVFFKLLKKKGIVIHSILRSLFPLILVIFFKGKIEIGKYGEFIAFTSLFIPFVSLGVLNLYIIENREFPNNSNILKYFISTLLISIITFQFIDPIFNFNSSFFSIFISFYFIDLIRVHFFNYNDLNERMIKTEFISFFILISPIIFLKDIEIKSIIYAKIISVISLNSIFLYKEILNFKQNLKVQLKDYLIGISYVPNKILTNSLEYLLINSSLLLGQKFQDDFYFYRKIAGIPQFFFNFKNQLLIKESYKTPGTILLTKSFSFLPYLILIFATIFFKSYFELSSILIHLSIIDLALGINYFNFLNKKTVTLTLINSIPLIFILFNYVTPSYFYYTLILYAFFKFLISIFFEKFNKRKLANT